MPVSDLPAHTPHARQIALLGTAVAADVLSIFFPVPSATIHQAVAALTERRLKESERILLEALEEGEISVLTETEYEFAIPSAFRFYQAARNGEARHNLRIMAGIIAGRIKSARTDPAEFLRISRQLEGLTISDLAALIAVREVDTEYRTPQRDVDVRDNRLISKVVPAFFENKDDLAASLSLLAGRGLIAPDQQTTLDARLQAYLSSAALDEIVALAKRELSGSK